MKEIHEVSAVKLHPSKSVSTCKASGISLTVSINKHLKLREGLTRATFGTIPSHSHTLLWFLLLVTLR